MSLKRELIYIDGRDETDHVSSYSYSGNMFDIVFKNKDKHYKYSKNRVRTIATALSADKALSVFDYLKAIADVVGIKTEDGGNILADNYNYIECVRNDSVLSSFLNAKLPKTNTNDDPNCIFPFSFNLSQVEAANKAFQCPISVIEGPPGTGKTQTILNIIANAVIRGQNVAIVSGNNSATRNVYEKLEKSGLGFMAALLGSSQNKREFIEQQKEFPDLSQFQLVGNDFDKARKQLSTLHSQITKHLSQQNKLAALRQQLDEISVEQKHFNSINNTYTQEIPTTWRHMSSSKWLTLWFTVEKRQGKHKDFGLFARLVLWLKYHVKGKYLRIYSQQQMILIAQLSYYETKVSELGNNIKQLEHDLEAFSFDNKMSDYATRATRLFKAALYERFHDKERGTYTFDELRLKSEAFIKDYPVILSTTYSLRGCLANNFLYDYVIIDECSQVDLATGALALSCAQRAVIVGDTKQLPNVVTHDMQVKTDNIFESSKLAEPYRYSNHSLLSSMIELFQGMPRTLLREHYRCDPIIIEFCNKKFYNDQLIVLTKQTEERTSMLVYKTVPGNHDRDHLNQRQIDMIRREIIPEENLNGVDLGIVTPYRNQTNALQEAFEGTGVKADTVDKFQGRENDVIILSTVDNQITDFTDNPNRLNVAISRAKEQLILVVNGNEQDKDRNITDLINYIEYHNFTIRESALRSIFDYLYKGYEERRQRIMDKHGRVSEYDSENLTYVLVKNVLSKGEFTKYDVILRYPLSYLIQDMSRLNGDERLYASNPNTHLDFLIYNRLGKAPVLAIEVDGYEFHKAGTLQAERDALKDSVLGKYGIPLLRLSTTGSDEIGLLVNTLREVSSGV